MNCPCDTHNFPKPRAISAGLAEAFRHARAIGTFPNWRTALLESVGQQPTLAGWRARDPLDFGLMFLEMGAYVFDSVSFYDALVAGESYLDTATLPGTRRRLVGLLGYRPRPATAASVRLAAEADGKTPIILPCGTAFRSGEFDGNPPQVFELDTGTAIDPRLNRQDVARVLEASLPSSLTGFLAEPGSVRLKPGDAVVLDIAGTLFARRVATLSREAPRAGAALTRVTLTGTISPPASATWADVRAYLPGARTSLWKLNLDPAEGSAAAGAQWSLEGRVPIQAGQIVLLEQGSNLEARRVASGTETQRTILSPLTSTITDSANNSSSLVSPAIKLACTMINLGAASSFTPDPALATVHYALYSAANIVAPLRDTLFQGDPIALPGLIDPPRVRVSGLLLRDTHEEAVATNGTLDAVARNAQGESSPAWGKTLTAPVTLFGNVLTASRGETVRGEMLGFGDGAQTTQTFKLAKKPLTYLNAANARGLAGTLSVRVAGVLWQEVESFFGVHGDAPVYIVRQDDAGDSFVIFGGGARLPTGAVVTADYRFGAGAAVPPANSVKQLAKPVVGLRRVFNPLPAFGGDEAESPAELSIYAPRSALLLGRAISLDDLGAAAGQVAGVRAANASWRWDAGGLRPAAVVTYIGDAQIAPAVVARLRELAEPDAPIRVERALPQPAVIEIELMADSAYVAVDVAAAVFEALYAAPRPVGGGPLRPERLGTDGVVFLSRVVATAMAVPGVAGIRTVSFDGTPFNETGRKPAAGHYFDFGDQGVAIHGAPVR